jgi:oxysterol-binding protein-related protein 8
MSAYFYMSPEHHIRIDGLLKPRSKFLGNRFVPQKSRRADENSAGTIMEGRAILTLLNRDNEEYVITQPNMYARFDSMQYSILTLSGEFYLAR